MNALEYTKLACGLLTAIIGVGGFKVYTDKQRYLQEVEKLKADVRAADSNVRSNELDNVKKAMQIVMDEIVEPLKEEINAIREELGKLRRAVEKAGDCRLATDCPVRIELQGTTESGAELPRRHTAPGGRVRANTAARAAKHRHHNIAGTLKAIPVGTGFSFRSGQATVSVKRLTGDSIQATATCDSLARQVILLSRELSRVSRQTATTVSQVPPQVIRQPSAWQWFWIRTGQIAVAALLLILIKRRLF